MKKLNLYFIPILVFALIIFFGFDYFFGSRYGTTFTQLNSSKLSVSPTPINFKLDTTDWKTYTNSKYRYTLTYDRNLYVSGKENGNSFLINSSLEAPSYPLFYVSVVYYFNPSTNKVEVVWPGYNLDEFSKISNESVLWSLPVGTKQKMMFQNDFEYEFTRLQDVLVDGIESKVFESINSYLRHKDKRIFVTKEDGSMYMIGTYGLGDNYDKFDQILSTFEFID